MRSAPHVILFSALALLAAACTPSPFIVDGNDGRNFHIELKDAGGGITSFEWEVGVEAPVWRTWNVLFDLKESYGLTGSYHLDSPPQWVTPESVRFVLTYDPHWYFPHLTAPVAGRVVPREMAVEAECLPGGALTDCYFRTTVHAVEGGKRSLVRMQGYMKRPWYVTFGTWAFLLKHDIGTLAAALPYRVQRPEYGTPDPRYPWTELNTLAADSAPQAATAEVPTVRRRIAFQKFETFGAGETTSSLAAVSEEYLATLVAHSGKFEVVTSDDLNVLVRYLGERWALLCQSGDTCQQRLADVARVDYLLTGSLRTQAGQYSLNLALLDASKGGSVWRYQRTLDPDGKALRAALEESSADLNRLEIK